MRGTDGAAAAGGHARARLRTATEMLLAGEALLIRSGERRLKLSPFDAAAERFIHTVFAGTSRDALTAACAAAGDDPARAAEWYDALEAGGFLERLDVDSGLGPADEARFDRLARLLSPHETDAVDRFTLLRRLRQARVGVVGTGGMGSWVIYNLLCCGVGHLRLIDGDRVEASNLNRAILYTEDDLGTPKVEAAARAVHRFAPRTTVETHDLHIDGQATLRPLLDGLDLLIGTADKPPWLIRHWIAAASHAAGVPSLQAGGTRIGPFHFPAEVTSCAMCEWAQLVERNPRLPAMLTAQRRLPAVDPGGFSPVASIGAGVVALDVFRYFTGSAALLTRNAVWELGANFEAHLRPLAPHPECPVCAAGAAVAAGAEQEPCLR